MFRKLISCLSSNSKKVLAALLNQKDSVSAQHLADSLNLSISQVRYSIKKIQACLAFNDIEIQQKQNEGIFIDISDQKRQELLSLLQTNPEEFGTLSQKERVQLLLQIILTSGKDLTPAAIRENTEISYTSFYRDIEKVRNWLNSFMLALAAQRNEPFHLTGEELKKREAIQEILFQNLGQDFLIQACILPVEDIDLNEVERSIFFYQGQNLIEEMDLPNCERQVRELEKAYSRNLFDRTHIELTLYLGILKTRIKSGHTLPVSAIKKAESTDGYLADAEGILQNIFKTELDPGWQVEVQYLANLLSQCFLHGANNSDEKDFESGASGENGTLARSIVNEIAKYLHAGLYDDKELTNCVEWELTQTARRNMADESNQSPSPAAQSRQSTTEQVLARILTPILTGNGIVNLGEVIAAISNHALAALERVRSLSFQRRVLLVCGAGIATAFSLRSQLNTMLPEVEITDMVSVFELAHNSELIEGCDAVISTIPLGNISSVPQIKVNSLLTEEDIEKIKRTLGLDIHPQYLAAPASLNRQFEFKEILNKKAIRTGVAANTPKEVIDQAGKLLLEMGAIWPSYITAMKNLYSLYGPYMVIAPNTALLHAGPEMGSKNLAISLITLKQPIDFGHKVYDPVSIALAFSSPVDSVHTNILSYVFSFFAVPENRSLIIQAGNPDDVLDILEKSGLEISNAA